MTRTQRTVSNSIWGMMQKMISLLSPFIIRTIIIKTLGADYLGLNGLFVSVLQVLNMAELGISSAITFSLYKPIAQKDSNTICALMNLYRKVYKCIGVGILFVGCCCTPFLSYVIKGEAPNGMNIYILYLMYLFNTALSYLLFAYKIALLDANQRNDIVNRTSIIVLTFQFSIQIILLLVYHNYYLYYIVTPIFTCVYNICISIIVDKKYPQYEAKGSLPPAMIKDLKMRVKGVLIGKFCSITRNTISSIIISATLGLVSVAIYSNYFLILTSVSSLMTVVVTAMSASVGNSMVTETESKNHHDFQRFTFMYAWISGWFACCLLCLYQPFMKIWLGEQLMLPFNMVVAFAFYFFVLTSGDIRAVYMNAMGLWWENRYRTILESLSNILFSLLFIKLFGIIGVLLGPMISLLIFNWGLSTIILYKYCFRNFNASIYFINYALYFVVVISVAIITYTLSQWLSIFTINIANLLVTLAVCIIVPNVLYYILLYRNKYTNDSIAFIYNIIRK